MIRSVLLIGVVVISACGVAQEPVVKVPEARAVVDGVAHVDKRVDEVVVSPLRQVVIPSKKPQEKCGLTYFHTSRNGVMLSLVAFDDRDYLLRVADQPKGVGSLWSDAKSAAEAFDGVAAVNGGFFTPEGKPLGLVVEDGVRRGFLNRSSLGAGMYVVSGDGSAIVRRADDGKKAKYLLQSGPMLVEDGNVVSGLSDRSRRPRSFIAWDGRHHWAVGYADAATLRELSKALAGNYPAGFEVKVALNLDGGRSSDLWVGSQVRNGSRTHRSFLNKNVRNYLVLKKIK